MGKPRRLDGGSLEGDSLEESSLNGTRQPRRSERKQLRMRQHRGWPGKGVMVVRGACLMTLARANQSCPSRASSGTSRRHLGNALAFQYHLRKTLPFPVGVGHPGNISGRPRGHPGNLYCLSRAPLPVREHFGKIVREHPGNMPGTSRGHFRPGEIYRRRPAATVPSGYDLIFGRFEKAAFPLWP
jgi:hypothetical protein